MHIWYTVCTKYKDQCNIIHVISKKRVIFFFSTYLSVCFDSHVDMSVGNAQQIWRGYHLMTMKHILSNEDSLTNKFVMKMNTNKMCFI